MVIIYVDGDKGYTANHVPRVGETINFEGDMRQVVDVTHNVKKQWDGSYLDYIFIQTKDINVNY